MEKSHFAEKAALILAIIALIGALVGIISMYRHDRKARAEEYERRSEELASEQLGTEALEFSARYQERMPSDGIVCWGDEGAYGNRVGSVPGTLGHIVNDRLYGAFAVENQRGHCLHALAASFRHPASNLPAEIRTPLPAWAETRGA